MLAIVLIVWERGLDQRLAGKNLVVVAVGIYHHNVAHSLCSAIALDMSEIAVTVASIALELPHKVILRVVEDRNQIRLVPYGLTVVVELDTGIADATLDTHVKSLADKLAAHRNLLD